METETTNPPLLPTPNGVEALALSGEKLTDGLVSEENPEKKQKEETFRCKLCIHIITCYSMFNTGWFVGMRGPAFPDLMKIAGVGAGAGSVFMSANYAGFVIGSMLCGFIIDRYNKYLTLAISALCCGCATFAIPLCSLFWLMILVNGIQGFGSGFILTGMFTIVGQLWSDSASARSFMQSFQLFLPLGAISSPLVIAPFLSSDSNTMSTNSTEYVSMKNGTQFFYPSLNTSFLTSIGPFNQIINDSSVSIHPPNITVVDLSRVGKGQRLIIPFSISGSMILIVTVLFLFVFFRDPWLKTKKKTSKETQLGDANDQKPSSFIVNVMTLFLIGSLSLLTKGTENSFTQFLPIFLQRKMHWDKVLSSDIMSVYWGPYTFGRFLGIFIAFYVKPPTFLYIGETLVVLSLILLLVGAIHYINALMWVCAALTGLGCSTILPFIVSWSHSEVLTSSGKHTSFLMVCGSMGTVIMPLIIGNLVDINYNWYIYVLLIEGCLFLILLTCLLVLVRKKLRGRNKSLEVTVGIDQDKGKIEIIE